MPGKRCCVHCSWTRRSVIEEEERGRWQAASGIGLHIRPVIGGDRQQHDEFTVMTRGQRR